MANNLQDILTRLDGLSDHVMIPERKQIFLSYAREDIDAARELYRVLNKLNKLVYIWFDEKSLQPGHNWKQEITKAIKQSDLFIALMSNHAVNKRGVVQKELRQAIEVMETMPPDKIYLLPVRLDDCQPQHPMLAEIHRVDLFPDLESGVQKLIFAIMPQIYSITALPVGFSRIDLLQIVNETFNFVNDTHNRYEIRLNQHMSQCEIFGDAQQLSQVILNMIINAQQFGNSKYPIEIDVYRIGSSAFVKVSNIGKYIPKDDIYSRRIFQPFYTTYSGGTGLGLAVANAIIELHGGSILVESTLIPASDSTAENSAEAVTSFIMSINLATKK